MFEYPVDYHALESGGIDRIVQLLDNVDIR